MASFQKRAAPLWPRWMLALFAGLAGISLLQGIVDVVAPTLRHERPFGFLFAATELWGPTFFMLYIFLHNLGLACMVPGFGFLAARFERSARNRALIGLILLGSVVVSLFVSAEYIIQEHQRFNLGLAIPLLIGETTAVLALAGVAAWELRGFVPTRTYSWSLIHPFRRLRIPFMVSVTLLALLAVVEARAVLLGA